MGDALAQKALEIGDAEQFIICLGVVSNNKDKDGNLIVDKYVCAEKFPKGDMPGVVVAFKKFVDREIYRL